MIGSLVVTKKVPIFVEVKHGVHFYNQILQDGIKEWDSWGKNSLYKKLHLIV